MVDLGVGFFVPPSTRAASLPAEVRLIASLAPGMMPRYMFEVRLSLLITSWSLCVDFVDKIVVFTPVPGHPVL